MSFLKSTAVDTSLSAFKFFETNFGFVPGLFHAQASLPRALEVEADLTDRLLVREGALGGLQKQLILLRVASAVRNSYCFALHFELLTRLGCKPTDLVQIATDHHGSDISPNEKSLLDFALKLSRKPLELNSNDFNELRRAGFTDEQLLEAEMCVAYEIFAATLATGLGLSPDFAGQQCPQSQTRLNDNNSLGLKTGSFLRQVELADDFWPYKFFKDSLGFVPSYFKAQTLRPDLIESQARALDAVLLTSDLLSRVQKEYIFLVISAANLNTYCVANHCGVLRGLGIPEDISDLVAFNHRSAGLASHDVTLLDFALKLTQHADDFSAQDIDELRNVGFSEEQILETVVLSGFANFINTMNIGLGVEPDFEPKHVFHFEHLAVRDDLSRLGEISATKLNLSADDARLTDEDHQLVARVCAGELEAFEDLVRKHKTRVYRTLIGITGDAIEAEDYTQNVFLKAYRNLSSFAGAARFSTWLTRIAINEGIEQMRRRHPRIESLEADNTDLGDFKPREVQAWTDDPEQCYSRKELRTIIETELMKLPANYRIVVLLRDIEQLSNLEVASALEMRVEAVKSRLLRGRLLLREALASKLKTRRVASV